MMKKILLGLSIFLTFLVVLIVATKPMVISFVKEKIKYIPGSTMAGVDVKLDYSLWSLLWQKAHGEVFIDSFKHGKMKIKAIKINLRWQGGYIYVDSLSGEVLNGIVRGSGNVRLVNPLKYIMELKFNNLDLERFVHDFELNDKFLLTGRLNGKVTLSGDPQEIYILDGDLTSSIGGGDLTISDTKFLENMASSAKLPSNLVVDSFKNYHYNEGLVRMFMDHGDLNLDASMQGEGGKRKLNVVLHDFKLN